MTRYVKFLTAGLIACSFMLSGCATNGPKALATGSDQTDNQKRARIRLQLAMGYYEQRQLAVALDEIKQALQADVNFSDAYNVRGLIYLEMGEIGLAEENFQHALRLEPANPELANNYGWFLCQTGQAAKSIAYFDTAVKSRSYAAPAKALNNAGVCSMKLQELKSAEAYFLQAFKLDPANLDVSLNLAKVLYGRGDVERARFYIGRVLKADSINAEILWLAIKIEHKLGDKLAEANLVTQLRRRFPSAPQYQAYQRGAFDE